ncbi:MAG: cytosine permease [bacterium]
MSENLITSYKEEAEDFPLSEVPDANRKGFWSLSTVLLGFTFFSATMWAGGSLGLSFKFFPDLIFLIVAGNILLGVYVAILSFIAFKSGLNTVLLSRYSLGEHGSKFSDILLGLTQVCWYAWGTATIAIVLAKLFNLDSSYNIIFMIFFGGLFCITAFIGYNGLKMLSYIAVPLMFVLIIISIIVSFKSAGKLGGILNIIPDKSMDYGMGLTLVFGTFVSGGTQSTNWTRFAASSKSAVFSSLLAFFIGNGLMIFIGAVGALVYNEAEISEVLKLQGLLSFGIIMLFFNIWTTQDNTIYNFSVAGCNFFRSTKRKIITLIGALIGTVLAIAGMYDWLVPYLLLLGTFIPPLGGIIMADFYVKYKSVYPKLEKNIKIKYNYIGIASYIIGSAAAYFLGFIPPITGIIVSFLVYSLLNYARIQYFNYPKSAI